MIGDKDQELRQQMLQNAIMNSEYKFIKLRLLDLRKNRIQGAYYLHGTPVDNQMTGMIDYVFEVRGGPLVFERDQLTGAMYHNMLDIEHNRDFLASMLSYNYWKIEDKTIESEIVELAKKKTKAAIRTQDPVVPKEKELTDDELERKLLELQSEATRRKLEKTRPVEIKNIPEPKLEAPVIVSSTPSEVIERDDLVTVVKLQEPVVTEIEDKVPQNEKPLSGKRVKRAA